MSNLKYTFKVTAKVFGVLFKRLGGQKKYPNWSFKKELIWTTTRTTLVASNDYGLEWLKKLSSSFSPKPQLASFVEVETIDTSIGSYQNITPKSSTSVNQPTIIYFHGGGYVTGSPKANIEFTTRLAIQSEAKLIVPFYPTAPEKVYPAAHQFASELVKLLLSEKENIYLAGDSAGATLVLSTIKNLSKEQFDKIKGCILISPWVEPLSNEGSILSNTNNDVGDRDFLVACYNAYMNGQNPAPSFPLTFDKNNLIELPKTLLTIGSGEMLLDQTNRLNEHLKELDTPTKLLTYESMFHTFWNLAPNIEEAEQIIKDIAEWVKNEAFD